MTGEGHDEIRELMVRHNPIPPHEVSAGVGPGDEEEILGRILREGASGRPRGGWLRGRGPALAVTALGVAVAMVIPFRIPPEPRQAPAPATAPVPPPATAPPEPPPAASPVPRLAGPAIPQDLARITRISVTEPRRETPPRPMASFPPASARLLELAALAAGRPRPATGPWSYVRTEEWLLATTVGPDGTDSATVPWVVSRWTPVGGEGTYHTVRTPGRPFGGGGWAGASPGGPPSVPGSARDGGRAEELEPRAATLSRSWTRLRGQLLGTEPQTTMTETRRLVRAMENLHSYDVVEPALAAVLWRVFAGQGDLRSLGRIRDRAGRPGQAFGFEDGPLLGVFVVSPATGGLLATELIRVAGDPRPVVEEYRTYAVSAWVKGAGRTS
ncbi:hypothetical protein [Streptosporangium sp. NBC_01756]|uniref:hypothetical protein n=1 Tax=Streptosporangium sp. NBC_01756 TaxID=2975950 RepID=UPI002DDB95A8|nr:hypothetical protein [Streptosporangium sp. NBC_01756]WSC87732.1 hypothetical protein OIE48_05835 [Streptosporangium sp. NBC_01756]